MLIYIKIKRKELHKNAKTSIFSKFSMLFSFFIEKNKKPIFHKKIRLSVLSKSDFSFLNQKKRE